MGHGYPEQTLTDKERRTFLKTLGVAGTIGATGAGLGDITLRDLQSAISVESTEELAAMGSAIRSGLTGELDASLISTELSALADEMGRLPELRSMGVPETLNTAYRELAEPAWRIEEHLAEVGFFERAEDHLPTFTPQHIESTAKELIRAESLTTMLSDVGFDDREQTAMMVNVVNNNDLLAQWVPVRVYEEDELGIGDDLIDPETVAPLHERAAAGALLWIDGLDWHLWQNQILITQRIIDHGIWDVKTMLGGFYLLSSAARGIAREEISDEQLTALVTGGTASMIIGQIDIANDVARITDEMRKPMEGA